MTSGGTAMPSPAARTTPPPGQERQAAAAQRQRRQQRHRAQHRHLAPDQHSDLSSGRDVERAERQTDGERPHGLGVARRRRHAHRGDEAEHQRSQPGLDGDEAAEATHIAGRPMVAASAAEGGNEDGGCPQRARASRRNTASFASSRRPCAVPEKAGHAADLGPRVPDAGQDEHDHECQCRRRETPRGEHRVGPATAPAPDWRARAGAPGRGARRPRCRRPAGASASTRDRRRRVRLPSGGGVAGGRGQPQRTEASRAARPRPAPPPPVRAWSAQVHPPGEEGAQHEQQAAAQ